MHVGRGAAVLAALLVASPVAVANELVELGGDEPQSLLYVWDASIPGDARATKRLLRFAQKRGFDTLALEASPVGYGEPDAEKRYAAFVDTAHASGTQVYALIGYPYFTVSPYAGLPDQPTSQEEGFELVRTIAATGLFDGLVDDSQPLEVTYDEGGVTKRYLWEQTDAAAQDYLDWLRGVDEFLGDLPYVQAVPPWFDSEPRLAALRLDGEQEVHSLSWYVARHVDVVNVLAYRDRAEGPGAILELVAGELSHGPVLVGVETQDRGAELAHTTFWEEGRSALKRELRTVARALEGDPHYLGTSVHHYGSARQMGRNGPRENKTSRRRR